MSKPPRIPSMFELAMSAAASAVRAKAEAQRPPWPPNPFARGIREGSGTDRVLALLLAVAPEHLEHGQIRMRLGASRGMVTWALKYLEAQDLVERVHDPRNPQYRRWRARRT